MNKMPTKADFVVSLKIAEMAPVLAPPTICGTVITLTGRWSNLSSGHDCTTHPQDALDLGQGGSTAS